MIRNITEINKCVVADPKKFVLGVEEEYHNRIKAVADTVLNKKDIKIILLAGPSASGKTTSAHIMCDYLKEHGVHTEMVSLDDFYKTHDRMPLDEFGKLDFESVFSLETDDIADCFNRLLQTGAADLPIFNFAKKCRETELRHIETGENGIVIVEGLHAMNPVITEHLPKKNILKLYISVGTEYTDEGENELLCSRDIRLMRRLSRDMIYRNSPPEKSLSLWNSVVRGENKNLCPYRSTADKQLVSFHDYEICLFKTLIYDLLIALPENVENSESIKNIINAMNKAGELNTEFIPEDSLMKEFMQGGKYE